VAFEREEPLKRELQDFVDAVREGRAPRVSGEDGRRALRLATRVTEAMAASPWPAAAGMAD
jgi:predicted dehydrogenase